MKRLNISSGSAYEKPIGFSRAVRIGNIISVAGTAPIAPDGTTYHPGDLYNQTKECLEIMKQAIIDAGGQLENVIRTRIFLKDISDWENAARAHGEYFSDIRPACSFIEVKGFIKDDWLIEAEADCVIAPRRRLMNFPALIFFLLLVPFCSYSQSKEEVYSYLKSMGNGHYLFGQVATWVHNENPDLDNKSNWLKKIYDYTGKMPRYGCITYDFDDNPFSDSDWNEAVKKMSDRGLIAGVFSFFANPSGGSWKDTVSIDPIFSQGDNPVKSNFYHQMDRMVSNLKWLKDKGITVVYTPFVELNDKNKWHAREGSKNAIRLYRLVHDYFAGKGLDNIIWAFHTTQGAGALEEYYPGDEYVDIIGKSAYGTGLIFSEYDWAVKKKKNNGKVIWWAELGIRGPSDAPRSCLDVLSKLENTFPELAGFVFWSDEDYYNVTGNPKAKELMTDPKIITLQ